MAYPRRPLVHKADLPTRVKKRGNEWKEQAIERGVEVTAQLAQRGNELRVRARAGIQRTREALGQTNGHPAKGASVRSRNKMTYELLSLFSGLVGGALAGAVFTRLWRAIAGAEEVPEPTQLDRRIRDVLVVGALQGAVFGVVKAGLSRVTARGYREITGHDFTR